MNPAYKEKADLEAVKPLKGYKSRSSNKMWSNDAALQSMRVIVLIPADKQGDMWFYRVDEINITILKSFNLFNSINL